MTAAGPRRPVRLAVYCFLAAIVLCGAFEVEAWPLSGFRLFSTLRTGTEVRWELVVVDEAGDEATADLAAMGRGFRQSSHLLPQLAGASDDDRADACRSWLERSTAAGELRVYRSVYVGERPGGAWRLASRTLQFQCDRP